MRRYDALATPLKAADFATGDRWAGLFSEPVPYAPTSPLMFKQDVLRITGAGTGTMERRGVSATWEVVDGALTVKVGADAFRYRRLALGPLGEERWVVEQLDASGKASTAAEIMAVRATVVPLDSAGVTKRYVGNINAGVLSSSVFYTLRNDGTWAITTKDKGAAETAAVFNRVWRPLSDGSLELVSVSTAGCNPWVGVATCRITSQRYWTFVGQQGKTRFAMETGPGPATAPITSWRFVAFTEVEPLAP
jgi:surface antigen